MISSGEQDHESIDFGRSLQRYLAGDERALETLSDRERQLALTLATAFERESGTDFVAREQGAPPRESDPIAIALGLVPGPADVLSAKRLQQARQRARVDLSALVELLQQRGWDVSAPQVLGWHSADTTLSPALINAIAEALDVQVHHLRGVPARRGSSDPGKLVNDAVIDAYLTEWATEIGLDAEGLREKAKRTLASLNFRNKADVSRDDVLAILRALRRIDPGGTAS